MDCRHSLSGSSRDAERVTVPFRICRPHRQRIFWRWSWVESEFWILKYFLYSSVKAKYFLYDDSPGIQRQEDCKSMNSNIESVSILRSRYF